MMGPMTDAATTTAAEKDLLYPSLAMPLMKMLPKAAMSATAVPEIPENITDARIAA